MSSPVVPAMIDDTIPSDILRLFAVVNDREIHIGGIHVDTVTLQEAQAAVVALTKGIEEKNPVLGSVITHGAKMRLMRDLRNMYRHMVGPNIEGEHLLAMAFDGVIMASKYYPWPGVEPDEEHYGMNIAGEGIRVNLPEITTKDGMMSFVNGGAVSDTFMTEIPEEAQSRFDAVTFGRQVRGGKVVVRYQGDDSTLTFPEDYFTRMEQDEDEESREWYRIIREARANRENNDPADSDDCDRNDTTDHLDYPEQNF